MAIACGPWTAQLQPVTLPTEVSQLLGLYMNTMRHEKFSLSLAVCCGIRLSYLMMRIMSLWSLVTGNCAVSVTYGRLAARLMHSQPAVYFVLQQPSLA
jgi:hypothetical protein